MEHKISKISKVKAMYMNLIFNTLATPVTTDYKGLVNANIYVYKLN